MFFSVFHANFYICYYGNCTMKMNVEDGKEVWKVLSESLLLLYKWAIIQHNFYTYFYTELQKESVKEAATEVQKIMLHNCKKNTQGIAVWKSVKFSVNILRNFSACNPLWNWKLARERGKKKLLGRVIFLYSFLLIPKKCRAIAQNTPELLLSSFWFNNPKTCLLLN